MTIVDNGPDLTALAATDRRVARDLSATERARAAAAQRIAADDAAAERRLREAEGRLNLAGRRDQVKSDRKARQAVQREADRRAKRARRAEWWQARRVQAAAAAGYVRGNAASVYSSVIYGLAVAGAVYGQIDAARLHQIPMLMAVAASIAIEGTGLAMALTAQHQRLARERALAARALVWICTAGAVTINYLGHVQENPAKAYVLSALSALGIVVFEIRSGAKHRSALRELGMIAQPGEQFGLARWLAYPAETFTAWRLGIRDRLSPGAAKLVARVVQARAARSAAAERVAAERRRVAEVSAAAKQRRKLTDEVARRARRAIRSAKGNPHTTVAALMQLSSLTPPLKALPSPARAEADAARLELGEARVRLAQEVQARKNAETAADEAEAFAALARAEAEAEATRVRREAEAAIAAVRREAEAEVRAARSRVEAEVARRGDAEARAEAAHASFRSEAQRRQEAEARAASAGQRAEAEAQRAAQMLGQAEAAGRGSETAQQRLAGEQQHRVDAEARAAAAERLLAAEQQRTARVEQQVQAGERQLAEAVEQVAQLRVQLAEAQAGRRARRATANVEMPGGMKFFPREPVLLHGEPVPDVQGVGPETVLKVLVARQGAPDATQKELAAEVGTSVRTVGAVLRAAQGPISEGLTSDNTEIEEAQQ